MKPSFWDKLGAALLLALPFVTVAVVGYAVFVAGATRAVVAARVYGGPTEGVDALSLRLEVVEAGGGLLARAPLEEVSVTARAEGRQARWSGRLDADGVAAVALALPSPSLAPIQLEVRASQASEPLARGRVALSRRDWLSQLRERGGWLAGQRSGALSIMAAPGRGAFAVSFEDPLLVEVRDARGPVASAALSFEPEGLTLAPRLDVHTDAQGRAVVGLTPKDFHVALRIAAVAADGGRGEWYSSVPVVAGALHARVTGRRALVSSAIPRERAYYALITERARVAGGALALTPTDSGGARGELALPALPPGPAWLELSSEPGLESLGAVGWPLEASSGEPPRSRLVPDRLLLDGLVEASALDRARRRQAQVFAGLFSLGAVMLLGAGLTLRALRARARLDASLRGAGQSTQEVERAMAGGFGATLAVAILCVALGFAVVALIAILRLS